MVGRVLGHLGFLVRPYQDASPAEALLQMISDLDTAVSNGRPKRHDALTPCGPSAERHTEPDAGTWASTARPCACG
ncbi:hypothetical protein HD593_001851 [Nonomuraea rubra]|uniref:Uncharacterized protein n=1 Tax=Nonomuraea rubra TaxID=46180 RepID=A0A7X0NPI9_9ACTN|nr:hypothetical protein [Nonomuraea rubra]